MAYRRVLYRSSAQSGATATGLSAGTYVVTVTDAKGCTTTASATITEPLAALAASIASQVNENCFGGTTGSATASAQDGTSPYTFVWNTTPAQSGRSEEHTSELQSHSELACRLLLATKASATITEPF